MDPAADPRDHNASNPAAAEAGPPQRCLRPWGWFETLAEGEGYRVKRLVLHPGQRLSLQRHQHRCEHWLVAAGSGRLELDGIEQPLQSGSAATIPLGAVHRASAADDGLVIIELQRGAVLSEADIERLADDYGRCSEPTPAEPQQASN